jgi:2-oxoglutarate ferredoxin oxidoreductase subunit gamma
MEKRVIIAGSGGQGILFFGKLLAYAAMIEGREVTWFPSYGAEMRGGTANCTVIISDSMIGSPVIRNPDILVAMNDASLNRFLERLAPRGTLIYDPSLIHSKIPRDDISVIKTPAAEISSSLNSAKSANMAMMGAFIAATGILEVDSVLSAVDEITPSHRRDLLALNKEIIMKGYTSFRPTALEARR